MVSGLQKYEQKNIRTDTFPDVKYLKIINLKDLILKM